MMTFLKTVAKFPNLLRKVCSARVLSLSISFHLRMSFYHSIPKSNFQHHQKPNCSWTLLIKNWPNFFQNLQNRTSNMSKHLILAKNRNSNLPSFTKNQTVCEHWTVCSTYTIKARKGLLPQSLKKHHRDCGTKEFIYNKV